MSSTPNVGMYDLCEVAPRTCLCRGYGPLYSRSGGTLGRVCERLETGWRPGVRPRQMNGNQQLPPGRLQTKLNTCARSQFVFLLGNSLCCYRWTPACLATSAKAKRSSIVPWAPFSRMEVSRNMGAQDLMGSQLPVVTQIRWLLTSTLASRCAVFFGVRPVLSIFVHVCSSGFLHVFAPQTE